jgi:hypothetical protein
MAGKGNKEKVDLSSIDLHTTETMLEEEMDERESIKLTAVYFFSR